MSFIEFKCISKRYGPVIANNNISFNIEAGSIHALVGENGAGKSTIMKIFFGLEQADSGTLFIDNKKMQIQTPEQAKNSGIGMVHQHFMLAGPISALDHVILESKNQRRLFWPLDRKKILKELEALSEKFNLNIPWQEKVEDLPIGIQQKLEILKILYNNSNILILDEPTAVLTPQEIDTFLKQLIEIKKQGKTIIIITHKLKEVFACADHVTVFRKGVLIDSKPIHDWTLDTLSESLVGHKLTALEFSPQKTEFIGKNILKVNNLFNKINFSIQKGEIVGIAGVEGNGQSQLIQAIINPSSIANLIQKSPNSTITLNDKNLLCLSNQKIRKLGVGYLAEDRHHQSVILDANLMENFLLGKQDVFQKFGIILKKSLLACLNQLVLKYEIKISSIAENMRQLSGGNQQKFVVARELSIPLKFLIASHPTRGVDIAAIQTIHQQLLNLKNSGCGILLVSSELEELMKLSDRILVICKKEIIQEFKRQDFSEKKIGAAMGGLKL